MSALLVRCRACKRPAPMHKPECETLVQADLDVRGALKALLKAVSQLPTPLCQQLAIDKDFMTAFRAGKEALR